MFRGVGLTTAVAASAARMLVPFATAASATGSAALSATEFFVTPTVKFSAATSPVLLMLSAVFATTLLGVAAILWRRS